VSEFVALASEVQQVSERVEMLALGIKVEWVRSCRRHNVAGHWARRDD